MSIKSYVRLQRTSNGFDLYEWEETALPYVLNPRVLDNRIQGQAYKIARLVGLCYFPSMARQPRIHLPGAVYHVMLRGNGGQDIFFENDDYLYLYDLLQEGIRRFGYRVHGFCCMSNHVHLAIQAGPVPLSRGMQNISFRYTRRINHRYKRMGHLFQGRYKALLVDRDSYLLELVRYIHLNPVRAGVERDPKSHRWSGHRTYIGQENLEWMTVDWVLGQFGSRVGEARRRYDRFIAEGHGEGHREEFHKGSDDARVLGDDRFIERVVSKTAKQAPHKIPLGKVIEIVCRVYGIREAHLKTAAQQRSHSEARAVMGWLVMELGCGTLTELGRRFNRDVGTMSSGVRRIADRSRQDPKLKSRLAKFKSVLA